MVTERLSATRLGLWDALLPSFRGAGWLEGAIPTEQAARLFLAVRAGPDPEGTLERLSALLGKAPDLATAALTEPRLGEALVTVVGTSRALTRTLADHPEWLQEALDDREISFEEAETHPARLAALRRFVRRRLLATAVRDILGLADMPQVGRELSDTADAAAEAALRAVQEEVRAAGWPVVPMAVVAMGKWGGRELNYASDIDLLFVHRVPKGMEAPAAAQGAIRVAEGFLEALGGVTPEGVAFRVDADLRPEGRDGPLARSLESYRAYYQRWAQTWEFQALLKARPAAGDPELGQAFAELVEPFVYPETLPPEAVREIRQMKARIEVTGSGRGTEIKRSAGGIRDVEFVTQLLQLVHGRFDLALRGRATLEVLEALGRFGYVPLEDARALAASYRWLRNVEHRLQLWDLRRTHELPAEATLRERLAKSLAYRDQPSGTALEAFEDELARHRKEVRSLYERLFYRPLLEAFAAAPTVRLSPESAGRRLTALGFRDVEGARRAFEDLTAGLSRRSRLMQQLLPLLLDWLSQSPNPDLGLAQLRGLVAEAPDNARLVGVLRDRPVAAERLCRLLGASRLVGQLLDRLPELLTHLADDGALRLEVDRKRLRAGIRRSVLSRRSHPARLAALRRFVRRRLLATAVRDILGLADMPQVGRELSDTADAAAEAALRAVQEEVRAAGWPVVPMAVVAMGKWGGRELNYASDIDLLFVHRVPKGMEAPAAAQGAIRVAEGFLEALGGVTPEGVAFRVDADLRPEGRDGPLARSLESYRAYYQRWAQTWEFQALLKARPAAGDPELGQAFAELVEPFVYPETLPPEAVREIRQMKARIEAERIDPGEDREFHLKLGPGGLVDVEFVTQLHQLLRGGRIPELRVSGTLEALDALSRHEILPPAAADALAEAYRFCGAVRNRLFLQAGRARDSLPGEVEEATGLALSLGYSTRPRASLREDYRRHTRRARRVVDRWFYEI
jgi:glutamate-ammonia-ligase adenylyltransferase